jgi:polyferredoxin
MKMPRLSGPVRRVAKILVAALMLAAVTAAFFGVRACAAAAKVQLVPALLAVDAVALGLLVVLIVLRGRLYCEIVCPLGIVQDFVRWVARKKVRRVCTRLPETKRQLAVRWTVFALFLVAGVAGLSFVWLDPYAIFGRGLTLTGGLFFLVLVLSFVGAGRFWCNGICPVGTLLQLVSRFAVFKNKVEKCDHCEECRKCFQK